MPAFVFASVSVSVFAVFERESVERALPNACAASEQPEAQADVIVSVSGPTAAVSFVVVVDSVVVRVGVSVCAFASVIATV